MKITVDPEMFDAARLAGLDVDPCPLHGDTPKRAGLGHDVLCAYHRAAFDLIPVHRRNEYGMPVSLIGHILVRKS